MAAGAILIDKKAHDLVISCPACSDAKAAPTSQQLTDLQDSILQAARIKFTKTEYISCPGCGRTLYDLRGTIAKIKAAVAQETAMSDKAEIWKGLKIGIMGCIVNGPGEMADADYGYVGAGPNRISLYKGKQCIEKNIPESEAVEKLLDYIKNDIK
jgi:(E)-4-hydroxy-3-methylbut-2-enyl-diphosphate synthase